MGNTPVEPSIDRLRQAVENLDSQLSRDQFKAEARFPGAKTSYMNEVISSIKQLDLKNMGTKDIKICMGMLESAISKFNIQSKALVDSANVVSRFHTHTMQGNANNINAVIKECQGRLDALKGNFLKQIKFHAEDMVSDYVSGAVKSFMAWKAVYQAVFPKNDTSKSDLIKPNDTSSSDGGPSSGNDSSDSETPTSTPRNE